MRTLLIAIVAVVLGSVSGSQAQDFPSRPITMIVPLPAGLAFDLTARLLAERMWVVLGQPIIIENLTGASGSVGAGRCARAAHAGYTRCVGGVGQDVLNGAVLALTYDVLKDFEPVSLVANAQLLIVAKKSMPANDLKELVAWLKENPNKETKGNGGAGGPATTPGH